MISVHLIPNADPSMSITSASLQHAYSSIPGEKVNVDNRGTATTPMSIMQGLSFIFPLNRVGRTVTVTAADLNRIEPEECLDDVIMDFYLRCVTSTTLLWNQTNCRIRRNRHRTSNAVTTS